jgi:hypothetical protein
VKVLRKGIFAAEDAEGAKIKGRTVDQVIK